MNAKYPERADTSTSTAPNYKPIHDWTSHYRTAFEYLINYLLENPTAEKCHRFVHSKKNINQEYIGKEVRDE